jgi:hypothetical protein
LSACSEDAAEEYAEVEGRRRACSGLTVLSDSVCIPKEDIETGVSAPLLEVLEECDQVALILETQYSGSVASAAFAISEI